MENTQSAVKTSFPRSKCGRFLKSKSGQSNHQRKCNWINPEIEEARGDLEEAERVHPSSQPDPAPKQHHSNFCSKSRTFTGVKEKDQTLNMTLTSHMSRLRTGVKTSSYFLQENLVTNLFVKSRRINCWIDNSIMIMPALLLQKPYCDSKSKDHLTALSRLISLWMQGNIKCH